MLQLHIIPCPASAPLPGGWKPLTVTVWQDFYTFIVITLMCARWPLCVTVSLPRAGTLNAFLKQKGQTASEGPVWSLSGNQGERWKQAKVSIHPTASFQVRPKKLNQPSTQRHFPLLPSIFFPDCVCMVKHSFPWGLHIDVALHKPRY